MTITTIIEFDNKEQYTFREGLNDHDQADIDEFGGEAIFTMLDRHNFNLAIQADDIAQKHKDTQRKHLNFDGLET